MNRPILFLDIDGVLNGMAGEHDDELASIFPRCVRELNRILTATLCRLVISSSWRYQILGGAVTDKGFKYMLYSHGVRFAEVIGHTCADEDLQGRGAQIARWLKEHGGRPHRYCVLDDDRYDIEEHGHPAVFTDGLHGLTAADADRVIAILRGMP